VEDLLRQIPADDGSPSLRSERRPDETLPQFSSEMLEEPSYARKLVFRVGRRVRCSITRACGLRGGGRSGGGAPGSRSLFGVSFSLPAPSPSSIFRFSSFDVRLNSPSASFRLLADLSEQLLRDRQQKAQSENQDQLRHCRDCPSAGRLLAPARRIGHPAQPGLIQVLTAMSPKC